MTRLDQNRAQTQLAQKAGVAVTDVDDIIIFGNHSPTMFADFTNATIGGKPAREVIGDDAWLENEFLPTVGKRGAAIIAARGLSSAASAANAAIDHVRSLHTPGDDIHSIAVRSDGSYGFDEGVWASVPVRTTAPGTYEVVREGCGPRRLREVQDRRDQRRAGRRSARRSRRCWASTPRRGRSGGPRPRTGRDGRRAARPGPRPGGRRRRAAPCPRRSRPG